MVKRSKSYRAMRPLLHETAAVLPSARQNGRAVLFEIGSSPMLARQPSHAAMIAGGQTQQIRLSLRDIAENQAVEILYACESGSRAWGFESTDSDWDIRFIYRRPIEAYLRLFPERDTIERMDDPLDFAGWDLLKTLRLAAKSNPALLEWLRSPIVYAETPIVARLRDLMEAFDPSAVMHHYVNVAERQVKAYWHPGKPVRFKKYFYAIRPLMCVTWVTSHGHAMPP